jgi:hypothetical protein
MFVSGEIGQERRQQRAAPGRAKGVSAILAAIVGVMRDTAEVASRPHVCRASKRKFPFSPN